MAKKTVKISLPRTEKALDALATSILAYAGPRIEGVNGAPPDWTDIPIEVWMAFKTAFEACVTKSVADSTHVLAVTDTKNAAHGAVDHFAHRYAWEIHLSANSGPNQLLNGPVGTARGIYRA
jgi:hypothetical protein